MQYRQIALGACSHRPMERNLKSLKIAVIGSGNVATHLARALSHTHNVVQIYSRNIDNARALAQTISNCQATNDLNHIADADVYLVSIKDDIITTIAQQVASKHQNALWLHTSGSVSAHVFKDHCQNYGVLYPLQTFSKNATVNISEVPFFIEANNDDTEQQIMNIAETLSNTVKKADSECRRRIHAAAVFACNFANHLWAIAHDILKEGDLEWDVLMPLLKVTLNKTKQLSPADAQTGPARRGDTGTMESHLALLNDHQAAIYRQLSESIINRYNTQQS